MTHYYSVNTDYDGNIVVKTTSEEGDARFLAAFMLEDFQEFGFRPAFAEIPGVLYEEDDEIGNFVTETGKKLFDESWIEEDEEEDAIL